MDKLPFILASLTMRYTSYPRCSAIWVLNQNLPDFDLTLPFLDAAIISGSMPPCSNPDNLI